MQTYKSGSHTRYDLKYHIVWITKYRKPVMIGQVAERLRDLVRQICQANDVLMGASISTTLSNLQISR